MPKWKSRNPDQVQQHNRPSTDNEAIACQLEALLTPAITAQQAYYRQLGLRERILNLPVWGKRVVFGTLTTQTPLPKVIEW